MMLQLSPDKEQRKHLAGLADKAAISFVGVFGYNAYVSELWIKFMLIVAIFVACEVGILLLLKERSDEKK